MLLPERWKSWPARDDVTAAPSASPASPRLARLPAEDCARSRCADASRSPPHRLDGDGGGDGAGEAGCAAGGEADGIRSAAPSPRAGAQRRSRTG